MAKKVKKGKKKAKKGDKAKGDKKAAKPKAASSGAPLEGIRYSDPEKAWVRPYARCLPLPPPEVANCSGGLAAMMAAAASRRYV